MPNAIDAKKSLTDVGEWLMSIGQCLGLCCGIVAIPLLLTTGSIALPVLLALGVAAAGCIGAGVLLQAFSDKFDHWYAPRSEFIAINQEVCTNDKKQARYESWGQEAAQHLVLERRPSLLVKTRGEQVDVTEEENANEHQNTMQHYPDGQKDKTSWWARFFGLAEKNRKDMFVYTDIHPKPNRSQKNR